MDSCRALLHRDFHTAPLLDDVSGLAKLERQGRVDVRVRNLALVVGEDVLHWMRRCGGERVGE